MDDRVLAQKCKLWSRYKDRVPHRLTEYWHIQSPSCCIVIHPKTQQIFNLNSTGLRVWSQCDGKKTVGEIANLIKKEFEVERNKVREDICELLKVLKQNSLIAWKSLE